MNKETPTEASIRLSKRLAMKISRLIEAEGDLGPMETNIKMSALNVTTAVHMLSLSDNDMEKGGRLASAFCQNLLGVMRDILIARAVERGFVPETENQATEK